MSLTVCYGQTIAPIHAEHTTKVGKTIRGSFQIQNNNVTPEPLTLDSSELSLDSNGTPHYGPLRSTTRVILSQTSGRLGPKEIRQIDYKISCDVLPCAVAIASAFTVGKTVDGIQVRLVLPFSVYLGTSKHPRVEALHAAGLDTKVVAKQ